MKVSPPVPLRVRCYLCSLSIASYLGRWTAAVNAAARAGFQGLWLGLLGRRQLHSLDQYFYNHDPLYSSREHNLQGLLPWETPVIDRFFAAGSRVLVLAAGGGREVLSLTHLGYEVHGFECNADLLTMANRLLHEHGKAPPVGIMERDLCPAIDIIFDGVIVGWSGYTLIQGRARRVDLLRQIRRLVEPGAPLLLSFFHRQQLGRQLRVSCTVANLLRAAQRAEPVEPGDQLAPNYVHFFDRREIETELAAGGFDLAHFSIEGYPHAVGVARNEVEGDDDAAR